MILTLFTLDMLFAVLLGYIFYLIHEGEKTRDNHNRSIHALTSRMSGLFASAVDTAAMRRTQEFEADVAGLHKTCEELRRLHDDHEQHSIAMARSLELTQRKYLGLEQSPDRFESELLRKEN